MQVTVIVPEGSISITGEEVYFSWEPVRPRHVKLAANVGEHLREITKLVEYHRHHNTKPDPEAAQKADPIKEV
jgi:hypothetical protein